MHEGLDPGGVDKNRPESAFLVLVIEVEEEVEVDVEVDVDESQN